ncbi:hypothetical protein [Hoyosella subflava]|uniref:Putative integral membrane protein n=1 Tax=Hoyosella subflava (strain DSM 45089 / JCM 17490 / NBRC 109087 / DQS3-9A1) TaxID=443218 RepID=F6EJE1_HOYSD|nr:hypothetical protein [Hoyosella subflava]AEF42557.1 Putative integral membrane protein [Hoyosella subflava DQS3-9A1]
MTASLSDLARQWTIAVSAVVAVAGAAVGSGGLGGTPISEAAEGALAADATFVAPGGPAFAIWSVLYAGFAALAVWQLFPNQRVNPRLRQTGWLIALALLLNGFWPLSVQFGWLNASVAVILGLLATLAVVFGRCLRSRPNGWLEAVLLDGVMGLFLGWVVVATIANIAAAAKAGGVGDFVLGGQPWAVIVLVVAAGVGAALALFSGGRIAVAIPIVWGLAWIAFARIAGAPESTAVAGTAVAAALVVALTTVFARATRIKTGESG